MITRQQVSAQLLAYLNEEISLAQLVDWAENVFVEGGLGPDEDVELLADILMYLAAADTRYFPLTWAVCQDFMKRLGSPVRVVPVWSLSMRQIERYWQVDDDEIAIVEGRS